MFSIKNITKALKGNESLLLILPKEISAELNIADQDLLEYEVKGMQIVINKLNFDKKSTANVTKDRGVEL